LVPGRPVISKQRPAPPNCQHTSPAESPVVGVRSAAMGLLSLGTPLSWDEAKKHAEHVRFHGITQFLAIWNRVKARKNDRLLWGDEASLALTLAETRQLTADVPRPSMLFFRARVNWPSAD